MAESDNRVLVSFTEEAYDDLQSFVMSSFLAGHTSGPLYEFGVLICKAIEANAESLHVTRAKPKEPNSNASDA